MDNWKSILLRGLETFNRFRAFDLTMIGQIARRLDELRDEIVSSMLKMVPGGVRPNLVVRYPGRSNRNLWLVSHMDVVPPGTGWNTDPFKPVVKEGKIYGRGTEDDGQGIISSIYALKALSDLGIKPEFNMNLAIVSDEETGNKYGIIHLISEGVFSKDDLALVPDGGNSEGTMIEIAEKGILWLRIAVKGKQIHASIPDKGLNANRIAMKLALAIDDVLHSKYSAEDKLFDPPGSTFEPTKREPNVENINTVPGLDISYFDCRVLPSYDLDDVVETVKEVAENFRHYGAQVKIEAVARGDSSFTDLKSEIVERVRRAVKLLRRKEAKPMGIGGGTCAAHLRKEGIQAAVWMTTDETAHQPNEYCIVNNLVEDAKVMAVVSLPSSQWNER